MQALSSNECKNCRSVSIIAEALIGITIIRAAKSSRRSAVIAMRVNKAQIFKTTGERCFRTSWTTRKWTPHSRGWKKSAKMGPSGDESKSAMKDSSLRYFTTSLHTAQYRAVRLNGNPFIWHVIGMFACLCQPDNKDAQALFCSLRLHSLTRSAVRDASNSSVMSRWRSAQRRWS